MFDYNLPECPLFAGLEKPEIETILQRTSAEIFTVDKGDHIVRQDDTVAALYILVSGTVRTEMITKEGNLLDIEFIGAGHPLAPAFIFADHNRFPVDVIAIEPCSFCIINKYEWLRELMLNERLLANFLRVNSNMTVFLSNKVQMMSIKSIRGKLALFILENSSAANPHITIKRSRTQLAEFFGVQRPSLARTLAEMVDEGVIALEKRELTVLDRRRLERMI